MENYRFYYDSDEFDPLIYIVDIVNKEAYYVSELDLKDINIMVYPINTVLDNIINKSIKEGYNGTWEQIQFVLEEPNIIEDFIKSANKVEYIDQLNKLAIEEFKDFDARYYLIDRIWERFENQSSKQNNKYLQLYNAMIDYINQLTDNQCEILNNEVTVLSNKEFFYNIINKANFTPSKINEKDFSF